MNETINLPPIVNNPEMLSPSCVMNLSVMESHNVSHICRNIDPNEKGMVSVLGDWLVEQHDLDLAGFLIAQIGSTPRPSKGIVDKCDVLRQVAVVSISRQVSAPGPLVKDPNGCWIQISVNQWVDFNFTNNLLGPQVNDEMRRH